MNRRGFLQLLGIGAASAAAGLVIDPEKLLWVPGAKTFFLPPVKVYGSINAATFSFWRNQQRLGASQNSVIYDNIHRTMRETFYRCNIGDNWIEA